MVPLPPPAAMAAVCVPKPPKACRAVGKAPPLAHAPAVITFVDLVNSTVLFIVGLKLVTQPASPVDPAAAP